MKKRLLALALALACCPAVALSAPAKKTLTLPILEKPVSVLVDKWGIPHFTAQSEADLFKAVGYWQAGDRWLQLEFARRGAMGTLSEIGGPKFKDHDKHQRDILLWRTAEQFVQSADPRVLAGLNAFSEGVNQWLKEKNHRPHKLYQITLTKARPWEPKDSAVIGAFMAWALSANYDNDFMVEKVIAKLGEEDGWKAVNHILNQIHSFGALHRKDITDPRLLGPAPKPQKGGKQSQHPPASLEEITQVAKRLENLGGVYPLKWGETGSNNWVIGPQLTEKKAPIVAGDTHMGLMAPALYWEAHLKAGEFETYGLCFPGSPMPILGFNRHVAWGATVLNANATDVWREKLSDDLKSYWFEGQWKPLEVLESPVMVNNMGAMKKEAHQVLLTHRGPLMDIDREKKTAHSLGWTGHLPIGNLLNGAMELNLAKSAKDVDHALRYFHAGGQNFVFGDTDGNFGYRSGSALPLRKPGWRGARVGDGATAAHDWTGQFLPFEEIPHTMNPKDGFIITANSPVMDRDVNYKHEFNVWAMYPFRVKRGWELVNNWKKKKHKITVKDAMSMQADNKHNVAVMALPPLLKLLAKEKLSPTEKKAVALLKSWDYHATLKSPATTLFHTWWQWTMSELVGSLLDDGFLGHPKNNLLTPAMVDLITGKFPLKWGDEALRKEGAPKRAVAIFHKAVAECVKAYGPDPKKWDWGKAHLVHFPSMMDEIPGIEAKFTVGPFPNDAAGDSLDEAFAHYREDSKAKFLQDFGPSMRMVVSLEKDGPKGFLTNTLGQALDPKSPFYKNQLQDWLNNRYHPALRLEKEIRQNLHEEVTLTPQ